MSYEVGEYIESLDLIILIGGDINDIHFLEF